MAIPPRFLDPLVVEQVGSKSGRTTWRLRTPLRYDSAVLGARVTIPAGFVTDLGSVPRLPLVWLVAGGKATRPSVVHDYFYCIQWPSRAEVDLLFWEAMAVERDPSSRISRWLMYQAVSWFGRRAWESDDLESRLSLSPKP